LFLGHKKPHVSNTPKMVVQIVVMRIGKIMSLGDTLCIDTRIAIMDVGKICNEVALRTKNIADAYSACSVLSKSLAVLTPYGVAAPEMPSKLTDKFMQAAFKVSSELVLNNLRAMGFNNLEIPRATPLSSHTRIKPNQTA